jgi:hypothetical protein
VVEEAVMKLIVISLATVIALLAPPAHADVIDVSLDASKFGKLDQNTTDCPTVNCGPTAAVNSFVYLQNQFPTVYTTPLVPAGKEKDVANTLNSDFMKTCAPGRDCAPGTGIEDFLLGKMDYIEKMDKGVTRYHAQMTDAWNPVTHLGVAKPDFVDDNTRPTIDFLAAELKAGEDIELALKPGFGPGHFLTLTGLSFDTGTGMGTITFVDPDGGKVRSASITRAMGENVSIMVDYQIREFPTARIVGAIAESPAKVPEPSSLLLVGSAVVGLAAVALAHRVPRVSK